MESHGEPLKIHISPQCKEKLDKLGGYLTEERGAVAMKGKGEIVTYWLIGENCLEFFDEPNLSNCRLTGTTEGAIEKRNVDLRDLPPPLFCRPRKSPKYISDSKQPSISCITNFGTSDNRSMFGESRRQSNTAQRLDLDGSHSLHGSLTGHLRESSPFITRHRKLDHTPLYINNNESEAFSDACDDLRREGLNGNGDDQDPSKKHSFIKVSPII